MVGSSGSDSNELYPQRSAQMPVLSEATTVTPTPHSGSTSGFDTQEKTDDFRERNTSVTPSRPTSRDSRDSPDSPNNTNNTNNDDDSSASSLVPKGGNAFTRKMHTWFSPTGKLRPFRLLKQDVGNIKSRYISDWTLFNQLIFASSIYVFFTNLLPGITFASDLYVRTGKTWGTIEIVFSTGLCGLIFSVFSSQPLTILGVTGPFSVLAETMYELCRDSFKIDFLPFMAWSLIHSFWMHLLLAAFNAHDWTMHYVTNFSADIFSLLNSIIYFHKAIQELQRNHAEVPLDSFLYSIIGCIGTFLLAVGLSSANNWGVLHRYIRLFLSEYAAAISIILFIAFPNIGELASLEKAKLAVSSSFRPSSPDRTIFFVRFWELPVTWVFAAIIPGLIITVLFFFDHEISSIICTLPRYGTKKPTGYAWDIALLGCTTAICGILGIPPANGLLPQAPLHSESLMHTRTEIQTFRDPVSGEEVDREVKVERVDEQRFSPFLQAAGIMAFCAPPLQHVLGLTPTSVLAGLFLFMGEQSLVTNPIFWRTLQMLTPQSELPELPRGVRWIAVHGYTLLEIVCSGIVFYVTLTIVSPSFPVIIIALVPVRLLLLNKIWNREVLRYVDSWACKDGTPEGDEDRKMEQKRKRKARRAAVEQEKEEEHEKAEPQPRGEDAV